MCRGMQCGGCSSASLSASLTSSLSACLVAVSCSAFPCIHSVRLLSSHLPSPTPLFRSFARMPLYYCIFLSTPPQRVSPDRPPTASPSAFNIFSFHTSQSLSSIHHRLPPATTAYTTMSKSSKWDGPMKDDILQAMFNYCPPNSDQKVQIVQYLDARGHDITWDAIR